MCEELWPVLLDLREARCKYLGDPRMVALPRRTKKRVIRGITNKGVLERVNGRRCLKDEAQFKHPVELSPNNVIR